MHLKYKITFSLVCNSEVLNRTYCLTTAVWNNAKLHFSVCILRLYQRLTVYYVE
jgi:hypothetical protein